ncbi:4Fe-4S dicluster domain-containing protein [Draconibacterium halophilum]|uniref:4Fe-4S dicluster domain-containing protein n=1 Tax=Draconibacterium halophilum TaxID=2706887 RepID=A0A6C0RC71_9BACT|nr:4Fe-4S dicluster domain-containing protein [Draconibacterium halophilum]QIA07502.1 4Fe-4S dicluster domain-containing protein [Draconibacterium halophilum]
MSINRRSFFKVLGVTGATFAFGKEAQAKTSNEDVTEFKAVLYDSTRCMGCQSCEFACAEAHGLPMPEDYPEAGVLRKTDETRRTVVNAYETPQGEVYVKRQCMHCNQPACDAACLTQAMHKTTQGPVIWREKKCMGCRYCMVSCPFDMPKFEYNSPNPKITKCDMCFDRQQEGKLPTCVENCPAEALVFGTRRELISEAHRRISENPDAYYNHIYGETEAGGTSFLYLSPVPFEELGFNTNVQNSSYPALTKGFLYSVPAVFVLVPSLLLGLNKATNSNLNKNEDHD